MSGAEMYAALVLGLVVVPFVLGVTLGVLDAARSARKGAGGYQRRTSALTVGPSDVGTFLGVSAGRPYQIALRATDRGRDEAGTEGETR